MIAVLAASGPLALFTMVAPATADVIDVGPTGVWLLKDDNGRVAAVQILPCGAGLCGQIIYLDDPLDGAGRMRRDDRNPDPALRGRLLCGLVVMGGFRPAGRDRWENGAIYNPLDGRTYGASLALDAAADALRVRAYLGSPLFGESRTLRRAPGSAARWLDPDCRTPPAQVTEATVR